MSGRPVVVTAAGAVRGRDDGRVAVWRGIRYGAPPTGRLRWRSPVAAEPWRGIAEADAFGPAAPQRPNPSVPLGPEGATRMDEDCLFLNVIRPSEEPPSGRPRPVMVWLHGGAYALGASSQLIYHGDALATSGDVVVVTLNYRLGALGFLDLRSAGVDAETNLALRDVLLALAWVRDNIHAFGGDPAAVTVFGQSAGAGLVTALLASPAGAGLFQRAIAQSPPAGSMFGPERSATVARSFLERLGGAHGGGDGDALRALPVEAIVDAGAEVYTEIPRVHPGMLAFAPVVGDDILPEAPIRVLSAGRGLPVPLLIGTNRDEATLFRLMRSPLLPIRRTALQRMFETMRAEQGDDGMLPPPERVLAAYDGRRFSRGVRVATDIAFRMPALWLASGHSRVARTHLYRFDFAPPLLRLSGVGASHATDLPYVWGEFGALPRDPSFLLGGRRAAAAVSARIRRRWAAYAHDGIPGEDWPAYDQAGRATLVIDEHDRLVPDLDRRLRQSWGAGPDLRLTGP